MTLLITGLLLPHLSYTQQKEIAGRPFVSNAGISVAMKSWQNPVRLGSPITVAVTVKNTESDLVSWEVRTHHSAETIFYYKLYFGTKPVKTTALFRMLWAEQEQDDPPEMEVQDSILFHLEPGESVTYKVNLDDLFQIAQPGTYTLEAKRTASDGKNIIRPQPFTFTVLLN